MEALHAGVIEVQPRRGLQVPRVRVFGREAQRRRLRVESGRRDEGGLAARRVQRARFLLEAREEAEKAAQASGGGRGAQRAREKEGVGGVRRGHGVRRRGGMRPMRTSGGSGNGGNGGSSGAMRGSRVGRAIVGAIIGAIVGTIIGTIIGTIVGTIIGAIVGTMNSSRRRRIGSLNGGEGIARGRGGGGFVDGSNGAAAHVEGLCGVARRGVHRPNIGVDDAADEGFVEAPLLRSGVVREIGEVQGAKELLGAREKGGDVFGEEEIGGEEDGEQARIADMRVETREDANGAQNGVRIGRHVLEMEGVRGVERIQVERLEVVLEERFFLQRTILHLTFNLSASLGIGTPSSSAES